MSVYDRRVWMELRKLRRAEQALQALYERLQGGGAPYAKTFLSSLKLLDRQVEHVENLLERAA
jgi:hypothetical protein